MPSKKKLERTGPPDRQPVGPPPKPYSVNNKWYMLVRLLSPGTIPAQPDIDTCYKFYLSDLEQFSKVEFVNYKYDIYRTPLRDDTGALFAAKAGVREAGGGEVKILSVIEDGEDGRKAELVRDIPRHVLDYKLFLKREKDWALGGVREVQNSEQDERRKGREAEETQGGKGKEKAQLGRRDEDPVESQLKDGEEEMRFTRDDGVNVWFGIVEMFVRYKNAVGDTRPAPGIPRPWVLNQQ
ncbi:hypothetical protein PTNB29_07996 [Pyrenophora teres f. teres]|nr:hypothetical protein PTNB29_07996 [Pyrenophora teres f. teres]